MVLQKYTCWGLEKPMRCDVMLSFCKAHLIASCEMLEPCACAYSAARLQAALTSSGAGCHAGGPWKPEHNGHLDFIATCSLTKMETSVL